MTQEFQDTSGNITEQVTLKALDNAKEILTQVWGLVKQENIPPAVERKLEQCFDLMPANTDINMVGMMFARPVQTTRLQLAGFTKEQTIPYLEKIGWQGESDRLAQMMAIAPANFSPFTLTFDVDEQVYPRIGLKYFTRCITKDAPPWQEFLEILVRHQLCSPEKGEALRKWPGYTQIKGSSPSFFQIIENTAALRENRLLNVMERNFGQIKMVYQPGLPFEAKAYLTCSCVNILVPRT
ncbi:hypothetical protein [Nostoc sp. DedVER01b]|uniref:hypothetical protein n=1 Tax=Nostoc sp. DedVER01b TaxID=3075404 RepID=UPI002AD4C058|nr:MULTISPECIES: hypothetical protein [unclassified Nostoc]MDZ7988771.1 hypothetical protein [Nostoc sp. DedVER02]MDZ8116605.1 hypothetical protein [Nostoc sp. DedVER01b]